MGGNWEYPKETDAEQERTYKLHAEWLLSLKSNPGPPTNLFEITFVSGESDETGDSFTAQILNTMSLGTVVILGWANLLEVPVR